MSMAVQFGNPDRGAPDFPKHPSAEVRLLRARLIMEEALETIQALGFNPNVYYNEAPHGLPITMGAVKFENRNLPIDLIEIADGCADLSVVTIGTLSACGIADEPLLEEVDRSNLDKFRGDAHRREDGKWVKPSDWVKPDIAAVLKAQMPETDYV